jgi:hypothetical protein
MLTYHTETTGAVDADDRPPVEHGRRAETRPRADGHPRLWSTHDTRRLAEATIAGVRSDGGPNLV